MTRKNLRNLAIFVLAATLFTPMAWSGKKKAKGEAEDSNGKKIKFSDFLKGTHGSDSAKWKAGFKYKKALRNSKKKK